MFTSAASCRSNARRYHALLAKEKRNDSHRCQTQQATTNANAKCLSEQDLPVFGTQAQHKHAPRCH